MRKLYSISAAAAALMVTAGLNAQVSRISTAQEPNHQPNSYPEYINKSKAGDQTKGAETLTVLWSEDFSNGFAGQGDNGAWTEGGTNGVLWFYTFPLGTPNGYDPDVALPAPQNEGYTNRIPNFFGTTATTISSPTAANGFMMIDTDRFNSTSTEESPDGTTLDVVVEAGLISPSIDLTGVTNAQIQMDLQHRMCCTNGVAQVDLSFDDGNSWSASYNVFTPYNTLNSVFDGQVVLDISSALAGADDLSQVRMRLLWAGGSTTYYMAVDDISIVETPAVDIYVGVVQNQLATDTWYNNYVEVDPFDPNLGLQEAALAYYKANEYWENPDYLLRPFNFGVIVSNQGTDATDASLSITMNDPNGNQVGDAVSSDPVTLESGSTDTIFFAGTFDQFLGGNEPLSGFYSINYEVVTSGEDARPSNNIGRVRTIGVNTDFNNNGFAIMRNDRGVNSTSQFTTLGSDVIWGTAYAFPEYEAEEAVITHVEASLYFSEGFAETSIGDIIYFNVRTGSIIGEDPEDVSTLTSVILDPDNPLTYEEGAAHIITEDDVWDVDGNQPAIPWATFELPSPVIIDPNLNYQAEFRVPAQSTAFPVLTRLNETFSSLLYDAVDAAWFNIGATSLRIRFRTQNAETVSTVTVDEGNKLIQNYPNPFTDVTRFDYQVMNSGNVRFELHDINGKLVVSENLGFKNAFERNTYELRRENLASGTYVYSIIAGDKRLSRTLVIE